MEKRERTRSRALAPIVLLVEMSRSVSLIAAANSLAFGFTTRPAPSVSTSGRLHPVEMIAGVPQARASRRETLNPSDAEESTKARAEAKRRYLSGSLTVPK